MSRKKITDEFLHYGSCVSLSLQESAFVHSTGFIDSSLYLSPLSEIHDFSQCLFRVLPLSIHTVQNELISSLESQDLAEYQEKYLALMEKLQGECTTNKQAYQKVKGEVVRFGTLVYLQHVESHKFLTLHPKETGTADRDTFKISLNDFPNDFSYFALQPSYNFQKEGDSIIRNSDVIILEIILAELNKPAYLAASEKLIEIESTKFEAKEISASLDHKSRWTLNLFSQTQLDKANCIKFGDFIWISHSEGAAVLISSIKEQNGVISFDNKLTNSNGLWKVENENETMGGYLYSGKVCRLKHMSTGLYFSVRLDDSGTQVANLTYKKHASSLWVFEQIYSQNKSVKICSDQFCSLVNFKYQVKLQGNNFKDPLVNIQVEFTNDNSEASYFKIFKSDENYLWESKFVLSCIPVLGPLPAFISEYSGKKYEDSYWAIKKFVKRMELVCICLKEIDLFVQNKQKSSVIFGRTKGLFNKTRQQFVRELGILDILSEILNCSFVGDLSLNKTLTIEKSEFKNKMSLFDQIQVNLDKDISTILLRELVHMVSLIYKVISTTCKDNLDNQMYAFRFFSIFQNHAGYHLGATCCMAGMLKNNETMLMHLQKGWANINLENGYSVIRHYIWLLRVTFT